MKPRLEVFPYTQEDWTIMKTATVRWMLRHRGAFGIARVYVPADRRDADLMLTWRRLRPLSGGQSMSVPDLGWLRFQDDLRWSAVGGTLS